jgi:hypothetical protein
MGAGDYCPSCFNHGLRSRDAFESASPLIGICGNHEFHARIHGNHGFQKFDEFQGIPGLNDIHGVQAYRMLSMWGPTRPWYHQKWEIKAWSHLVCPSPEIRHIGLNATGSLRTPPLRESHQMWFLTLCVRCTTRAT